ncbi:unnamed protein product [Acidithrix sp. C25]|nr:unnamed protein product [Acidithrix sp. C25]
MRNTIYNSSWTKAYLEPSHRGATIGATDDIAMAPDSYYKM